MSAFSSNEHDSSREKLVVHINDDGQHNASSIGPFQQQQPQRYHHSAMLERTAKAMFALVSLFLLIILCTYIGSKTIFDSSSAGKSAGEATGDSDGRKGLAPLPQNEIKDCRAAGCYNNFECVEVKVDQACFVQPCPSVVYECLPPAMLNDAADAVFSIQPMPQGDGELGSDDSDSTGELTQGYFSCVQRHGGKNIWNHPEQPCNTCRCTANGSVACTKMFCASPRPGGSFAQDSNVLPADSSEPHMPTTMISPVPHSASGDPENTSQLYTSIVVDVRA